MVRTYLLIPLGDCLFLPRVTVGQVCQICISESECLADPVPAVFTWTPEGPGAGIGGEGRTKPKKIGVTHQASCVCLRTTTMPGLVEC